MHAQPAGPLSDTNVVFAGSVSVSTTVVAAAGPPFVTVCVYVILLPAVTGFGLAELVTRRSACVAPATAIEDVAELSVVLVSREVVPAVAVSVMIVPAAVPAFTLNTTVNTADDPAATLGFVQELAGNPVQVQPAGGVTDTNVVFAGIASVNVAVLQLLGPPLVTVCV